MKATCLRKYQPGRALVIRLVDAATSAKAFVKFKIHVDYTPHCSLFSCCVYCSPVLCLLLGRWLAVDWLCPVCRRSSGTHQHIVPSPRTPPMLLLLLSGQDFFGVRTSYLRQMKPSNTVLAGSGSPDVNTNGTRK